MFDFFKKKTIEEKMDIIKTSYEKQQESMVESKSPGEKYIWVEGFKGTDSNMCCTVIRGYERNREQYELNIPKVLKGKPKNGIYGFHFSKKLDCVFRYYPFDFYNRYFKVKALVEKKDYDDEWSMSFAAKEIILCEEIYPKYEEVKEYLKYTTAKYHKAYQLTKEDFYGIKERGKERYFEDKFISELVKSGYSYPLANLVFEQYSNDIAYMNHIVDIATVLKKEGVSKDMIAYILLGGANEVK